ncbi:hypothetical protein GOP47_0018479 [Adiantum capillus-veneris]|uniref:MCAfunc domain-containing protein n=1 Tax=Adiantum capillus-veneris TaxID=13818 RepID=A0A9D4UDG8_ADICA|nr:hypothetical protein GOP47_0018479 [Adiantum capillus-veneris]
MSHLSWNHLGEVATAAQLTGLDSVKIIALIVKAANNARMHKKNCKQFAQHLKLIGNLLEQLKLSDLKEWPETREPLEELEEALKRAFLLVNSCKDKSYLYLLALGWSTVSQFKERQAEIDRLLGLIPLITLVDNNRERFHAIEKDERLYTLDEEEMKIHETVLKTEVTAKDARMLEKSLSRSYPGLSLDEVLKEENSKLRVELQQVEESMEMDQVDVIHHLIDVTETVIPQKHKLRQSSSTLRSKHLEVTKEFSQANHKHVKENCYTLEQQEPCYSEHLDTSPREEKETSFSKGEFSLKESNKEPSPWSNDLLDCCMDPYFCVSTCMYPCGTFSDVAAFASGGKVTPEDACNDFMTYSLVLSCCCYTCCVRRKLRKRYNIEGGCCEDLCTHVLCFYCALIQEWHEILAREGEGKSMSPPVSQKMERDG